MALDRIENLIEKYFDAKTTIAEEKELKAYFTSTNVAQHLEQYKPIFGYVYQAKQEQFKATLPLHKPHSNKKSPMTFWLSVAASATVFLGVGLFTYHSFNQPETQNLGEINDPEIAFRETQKALNMISEQVNKGIGSMNYLNEYQQSKNKIFK
ncbi:hypothetical protein [Flavobacterium sedimenticola]|uniref:Anti-sigma factor n=1 Tax=Flavobacterium sedimenticola TaxID=3043286 RepID=A0ABT6XNV7_9FLAO|nr:hypothetical protein [Flavobacterium sedimenticola]MDI9256657.1 hypothetical protein [Flavobacterium sedimenticola]